MYGQEKDPKRGQFSNSSREIHIRLETEAVAKKIDAIHAVSVRNKFPKIKQRPTPLIDKNKSKLRHRNPSAKNIQHKLQNHNERDRS